MIPIEIQDIQLTEVPVAEWFDCDTGLGSGRCQGKLYNWWFMHFNTGFWWHQCETKRKRSTQGQQTTIWHTHRSGWRILVTWDDKIYRIAVYAPLEKVDDAN